VVVSGRATTIASRQRRDTRTTCSIGPSGGCASSAASATTRRSRRSSPRRRTGCRCGSSPWCVMPSHWHLVLWPRGDGDLSEFIRWLTVTHTQRWHAAHQTADAGPLYQGRFKSFPIQEDEHLLAVLRYVERKGAAGEAGRGGRRLAVVESVASAPRRRGGPGRRRPGGAAAALAAARRGPTDRGGTRGIAAVGGPRGAVRPGRMAIADGKTPGAGIDLASPGPAVEIASGEGGARIDRRNRALPTPLPCSR
jgi:hypothetical protein